MTTEERLENLEKGLARVKRRNRLLLIGVLLGAVVITAVIIKPKNVIKASEFVLVDVGGKTRATLSMFVGGPRLVLYDENEAFRVGLLVEEEGPRLVLLDNNGEFRVGLEAREKVASLTLYDKNGKTGTRLAARGLGLYDENEKLRISLLPDVPVMALYDENDKLRIGLAASKDGPRLDLCDENGKARALLGRGQTTTPDGKVISYPESSLLLFNPEGKVVWQAPP